MKPTYVGVLAASLFIVFKMILFFTNQQYTVLVKTPWVPLLMVVLIGIFYAINHYIRTSSQYDWIVAFKKGVTVSLIAGVIAGIFVYVYYAFIDIDFLPLRQIEMYNQMKGEIAKEQMEKSDKSLKAAFSPRTFAIVTISAVNILGLIGSVIVALLGRITVRRK